ncbi:radical SAM protein [Methanolapillus ohkumae]|uniref:Radical SAM core domain-containing protein n=1 Tax=Methanolapillus ohkumae TaxID=3028298 RepID=A0AA96VHU5_9EURY|nr:hypothetical protein MsAm2_05380 [Methanosarcinaceae archaeon Am2]
MNVIILDGYVDEPACFGVPPYISPYPRYVAGALLECGFSADNILYLTIDQVRATGKSWTQAIKTADVFIVISGMTVPGKYLTGTPITDEEIRALFRLAGGIKILGGPIRLGYSQEGGKIATAADLFLPKDVLLAQKDIESFVFDYFQNTNGAPQNPSNQPPSSQPPANQNSNLIVHRYRKTPEIARWSKNGAFVVGQHPNFPDIICEIETYRGCGRKKHCSFCTESFYGRPDFRDEEDIAAEVRALYENQARHFRIGRQPDLFAYKGIDAGFPFLKPNPAAIENLYRGIREAAPDLKTLHMDNGNPVTIAAFPNEAAEILRTIIRYHTPGDVIAMGLESADPAVISANDLKASPEQVMDAIRLVNKIGAARGENGMPEILPGLNFVHGLLGETKKTFQLNADFLKQVYDEGLMLRRINIRQVMAFPKTPIFEKLNAGSSHPQNQKADLSQKYVLDKKSNSKHMQKNDYFQNYKEKIRKEIDLPMLRRVVPAGTVLKDVFAEIHETTSASKSEITFGRQFGTYPLLIGIPEKLELGRFYDIVITGHGYRSVSGILYPVKINSVSAALLKELPGLNQKMAESILSNRPYADEKELIEKSEHGKMIVRFVSFEA